MKIITLIIEIEARYLPGTESVQWKCSQASSSMTGSSDVVCSFLHHHDLTVPRPPKVFHPLDPDQTRRV